MLFNIWCILIPQACIVINLIQQLRINPKLSAYAQVHGAYAFNSTPVAPPVTRVVVHEKPAVCKIWSIRGTDGWYLGHALHHYIYSDFFPIKYPTSALRTLLIFSRITSSFLFHNQNTTPLKQQKHLHMLYKIQPQAHHSRSLEIPPWYP